MRLFSHLPTMDVRLVGRVACQWDSASPGRRADFRSEDEDYRSVLRTWRIA
ncbi:MAG: hypothetical protein RLZZ232_3160 [Planctomycetota bacterium]|jgi:hypothetical protein